MRRKCCSPNGLKKWVFRFSREKKKTIKTLFIDHKQWNDFWKTIINWGMHALFRNFPKVRKGKYEMGMWPLKIHHCEMVLLKIEFRSFDKKWWLLTKPKHNGFTRNLHDTRMCVCMFLAKYLKYDISLRLYKGFCGFSYFCDSHRGREINA